MKNEYLDPVMEVTRFANCDLIVTSETVGEGDGELSIGDNGKDF